MVSFVYNIHFAYCCQELSLADALDDDDDKPPTPKPEQKLPKTGEDGLDLADALIPDPKKPDAEDPKQPVVPPKDGGTFSVSDLEEASNDGYNPDVSPGGRSGGNAGDIPSKFFFLFIVNVRCRLCYPGS
ncbi:hypothetical protein PDJAM_G00160760 [Pangasius djambal]|uniref:Uncharacterized protein n=1 Tax=Pangasius djambal TaxID=1691987 RepID=A0ACC5ZK79_9TELE|nr:hypothetical protein [Pangasius djambal]